VIRARRLFLAIALGAAALPAYPAAIRCAAGQEARSHLVELAARGITLRCNDNGKLLGLSATVSEPVKRLDADGFFEAEGVATRRATNAYWEFLKKRQSVDAAAREIERSARASAGGELLGAGETPVDTRRALAADLTTFRQRLAAGGASPEPLVESGTDVGRKMAWARVSLGEQPRPPAPMDSSLAVAAAAVVAPRSAIPTHSDRGSGPRPPPLVRIYNVSPTYPPTARSAAVEGVVVVTALIAADGAVTDARVATSSSSPLLDQAALNAVRLWRFIPQVVDGTPTPSTITATVAFQLK
jgi:TonB family protein